MIKILLLNDFSSGYCRSLLKGIVEYAKKHDSWSFYRMPLSFIELYGVDGVVKWVEKWGANAIIAQFIDIDFDVLNKLNIPIVVQNYSNRHGYLSNLTGDYFNTGVMAADFFLHKGYKNFAYYGFNDTIWSRERGEGFISKVEEHECTVFHYSDQQERKKKWDYDHEILKKWLENLPKPIAIFACDDFHAIQITEMCKISSIHVPNEVAVLGVDNDELLCNISDPKLSSIELDVENGGYLTAKLVYDLLEKKATSPIDIIIQPVRIVSRKSTEKYATSNKYILNIMEFIDEKYMDNISVTDIINIVPFSRRVLEKLFKKETGITIYHYIQLVRIEKFSNLLITTNLPLTDAALEAGFYDYKNVSRIFIKEKKISPFQFRKAHQVAAHKFE